MEVIGHDLILSPDDIHRMNAGEPLRIPRGVTSLITEPGLRYLDDAEGPTAEAARERFRDFRRDEDPSLGITVEPVGDREVLVRLPAKVANLFAHDLGQWAKAWRVALRGEQEGDEELVG